ncbi:MAG: cytochrome c biogenesis protein CcdA [Bacteroidia bacterium]
MISNLNDWVTTQLAADQTGPGAFLFLLIGGFLASLLPCTYPLYPITINVLRTRSEGRRNFLHPLAYYLGLATIYLVLGLIAGIGSGAFNEVMRYPLTNLAIAAILLVMGVAAAGWLHLPWFGGSSSPGQRQGLPGTFMMGAGAGLLASSCVGPVVISVLVGLASRSPGTLSVASVAVAAAKMFAFGLGLGLPFLLIGVFGVKLPRSGRWMQYVQIALGLMIIYFAYTYLEKALLTWGFTSASVAATGAGAMLFLLAMYRLQSSETGTYARMERALWGLAALAAALVLVRAVVPTQGLPGSAQAGAQTEAKGNLTWHLDRDAAYAAARQSGKPVFIDFFGNWCANCKAFERLAQTDSSLNQALQQAVLLKVYDSSDLFKEYRDDPRFPELKVGLPFFLITDTEGHLLYKTNDYLKTDEMRLFLTP